MKDSKIEWTDHTGGPWLGCTKVSPGCGNCYSCALANTRHEHFFRKAYRTAGFSDWNTRPVWGENAPRLMTEGFRRDARRINAQHARAGTRGRWFPSLIDWLDDMPAGIIDQDGNYLAPLEVLADFLKVIQDTPNLDWMLLTKRPENLQLRVGAVAQQRGDSCALSRSWADEGKPPANVWVGVSVEDQVRAEERIPSLLGIPADVRFLSCEPLLTAVNITPWLVGRAANPGDGARRASSPAINLVICGGESGPKARPMHPAWARSLRDQCLEAQVPFFFKQWGEWMAGDTAPAGAREVRDVPDAADGAPINVQRMYRVGKVAAGRVLDGVTWDQMPVAPDAGAIHPIVTELQL